MGTLRLSFEGDLRANTIHAFDQLAAALEETVAGRDSVTDVLLSVDESEATVSMKISAERWQEASDIALAVIGEAVARTGLHFVEMPDQSVFTTKSILNEGRRFTLI